MKEDNTLLLCLSCLAITYLFICCSGIGSCHVLHSFCPFAQTALLTNVHCNELLVWFKASGFRYPNDTGSSLRLFSDILLLPRVFLHPLQKLIDGVDVEGQLISLNLGLSSSCLGQLRSWLGLPSPSERGWPFLLNPYHCWASSPESRVQ